MIKLEKIKEEKKKNKLSFLLKGGNEAFANTIRRLILEEVPTLAIEDVEIKENNSAMSDEMVALRLGLVPIKTDLKSYNLKEKCKCKGEGCAQCELKITLKSSKKGYVQAGDAKSTDPKCNFVQEKMPVIKLLPKQKVDLTMTAVLGQGKMHAKWAPGLAHYRKEPIVDASKTKNPENLLKNCPDGVFAKKGNKIDVVKEKAYESQLLEYYSNLDKGITVSEGENIVFTLEGWGQLSCKEILSESAQILAGKVEEMEKLI